MLKALSIRNFAIIDDAAIRFSPGFTVITGETGAGKSILVMALRLLLGERADSSMIRSGEKQAEIDAVFEVDPANPAALVLESLGYEHDGEILVRRVLSAENRHRAFLNGRPATMQIISSVTRNLAGISGQHSHQRLLDEKEHAAVLDRFAGIENLRKDIAALREQILKDAKSLENLLEASRCHDERMELLEFQAREIEEAALVPGEDKQLQEEAGMLRNAELLRETTRRAAYELYEQEGAVSERLRVTIKEISSAARHDPGLERFASALAGAADSIDETARDLFNYSETCEFDPQRLADIEARLELINSLKRKYGRTIEDVLMRKKEIAAEMEKARSGQEEIKELSARLETAKKRLVELASDLGKKRLSASRDFCAAMEKALAELNMPETVFRVKLEKIRAGRMSCEWVCSPDGFEITENGMEEVSFLFSANPGEEPKPLSRIASGGELSRVVLAFMSILAGIEPARTMVFDEVDAGIGGVTADVVGEKLFSLSATHQVICITHLAQIARFAENHLKITKIIEKGRTVTRIHPLASRDERAKEIARMIGGASKTEASLQHAKELIDSARSR